jgi:hypothetical protein
MIVQGVVFVLRYAWLGAYCRIKIKIVEGRDGKNVLSTFVAALQPCSLPTILTGIKSAALQNFSLALSLLPSVLSHGDFLLEN